MQNSIAKLPKLLLACLGIVDEPNRTSGCHFAGLYCWTLSTQTAEIEHTPAALQNNPTPRTCKTKR